MKIVLKNLVIWENLLSNKIARNKNHKQFDDFKLDKTSVSNYKLGEEPNDKEYWLSKTPFERLEALEFLRQIFFNYDPNTERLQRIVENSYFKKDTLIIKI